MTKNSQTVIYLGADHGGFRLKQMIKESLKEQGYQVKDLGASQLNPKDDYPDMAEKVAQKVANNQQALGILFCRTGGGMVVAANKIDGIRAVDVRDEKGAELAREKNNANIISLGADLVTLDQAKQTISAFLGTEFTKEKRHKRRIEKIKQMEKEQQ